MRTYKVDVALADLKRRLETGQSFESAHDCVWFTFSLTQEEAGKVTSAYIRDSMVKGDIIDSDIMSTIEENNESISLPCTTAAQYESRRYCMLRRACIGLTLFVLRHIPTDKICDPIWLDRKTCVGYVDRDQAMDAIREMDQKWWEHYAAMPCPRDWRVTELG